MGTWGLGVGLGNNPLGFGGWDMGFRGGTRGQPFRFWGLDQKHTLGGDNPLGFGGWDMGTWGLVRFRFFTGHCLDIVPDVVPHVTQLSPSGKCTRGYLYMYIKTNIYIYI